MRNYFKDDLKAMQMLAYSSFLYEDLFIKFEESAKIIIEALKNGNKILICGNGGSASDAEHMAGEIVGRFGYDRESLPCISLCTPSATFTAISNDYGYEKVFERQVQGFGKHGDILIGISTSGNSLNIVKAFESAEKLGIKTIGMTGQKDSKLSEISNICLKVPSTKTPRIQEIHGLIIHSLCRAIEDEIFSKASVPALPSNKIIGKDNIEKFAKAIKNYSSVFTNGCFDILHPGHVYILKECRKYGELLIVGLNSDNSIKRLKGDKRPYHKFNDRANVLSALECVDYVIEFDEDTPQKLIETLTPKVLIKGGDYTVDTVVGAQHVINNGGKVVIIPLLEGHSTTAILNDKKQK